MAFAPNTSSFVLVSPDVADLPNSRTLFATGGITLTDSGPTGALTVIPVGNLATLNSYNSTGFVSYNATGGIFAGRVMTGSAGISIINADGTGGNPQFFAVPNSSVQQVQVELNGLLLSTRGTINLIPGANISVSVSDNSGNNSADITISAPVAGGTVSSVSATSPSATIVIGGSPITTAGTLTFNLATSGVTAGSYTSTNLTVDTYGRITAASNGSGGGGGGTVTSITAGTGLNGGTITTTGTISIANTSVTPGSYTFANLTVNAQGQLTVASSGVPVTSITAGTGLSGGTITSTGTISLAATTVTAGSYTYGNFTVNGSGQLTAASSGTPPVTTVSGTAGQINSTGGLAPVLSLVTTAVTPGTYTATNLTVDSFGRITAAANGSGGGGGTVTSITAGVGLNGGTITTTGTISLANTTVTAGSYTSANITVNAQGQITTASSGAASFAYTILGSGVTTQAIAANNGYVTTNNTTQVVFALPSSGIAAGQIFDVVGFGTAGWQITQQVGQSIALGNQTTTIGTGGSLTSTFTTDRVQVLCVVANTSFTVLCPVGNITVT